MTTVGSWQPDRTGSGIDAATLSRLARCADQLDHATLGLGTEEVAGYAHLMRAAADVWKSAAATLDDGTLVALIRVLTVAESKLANWEAGNASPVIPLAATLRGRGTYPKELTAWIKAHSDNRFLPWGSLLDRL
jgi:hypothetical protein